MKQDTIKNVPTDVLVLVIDFIDYYREVTKARSKHNVLFKSEFICIHLYEYRKSLRSIIPQNTLQDFNGLLSSEIYTKLGTNILSFNGMFKIVNGDYNMVVTLANKYRIKFLAQIKSVVNKELKARNVIGLGK